MRHKFYDYDYSGYCAKPLDYVDPNQPVNTVSKCKNCNQNLGCQSTLDSCGHCRSLTRMY